MQKHFSFFVLDGRPLRLFYSQFPVMFPYMICISGKFLFVEKSVIISYTIFSYSVIQSQIYASLYGGQWRREKIVSCGMIPYKSVRRADAFIER